MSETNLKCCKKCFIAKPESDYYKIGSYSYGSCKSCHREYVKSKKQPALKKSGFYKLDQKTRDRFLQMMGDGKSKTTISVELNIPYQNIVYWCKSGHLPSNPLPLNS